MREHLWPWPVEIPKDWVRWINKPQTEAELAALHRAQDRGRPYGDKRWTQWTSHRLGIESAPRPIGRLKKKAKRQSRERKAYDPLIRPRTSNCLACRSLYGPAGMVGGFSVAHAAINMDLIVSSRFLPC